MRKQRYSDTPAQAIDPVNSQRKYPSQSIDRAFQDCTGVPSPNPAKNSVFKATHGDFNAD